MTSLPPLSIWKSFRGPANESWREITRRVAEQHGLTLDDMFSRSRSREIVWPRQQAWAEIYATGRFSYPRIAELFGGFDHTSVMHGLKQHRARQAQLIPTIHNAVSGLQPVLTAD